MTESIRIIQSSAPVMLPVEDIYHRETARKRDRAEVARLTRVYSAVGYFEDDAICVACDGDVYLIVDGGHRFDAAVAAGMRHIPAVVYSSISEALILTYEGAKNIQRADTEEENLRRCQLQLSLGVRPAEIEAATGIEEDEQRLIQRVRRRINDETALEDMHTLARFHALDELADDPEATRAVLNASEKEWPRIYEEHKRTLTLAAGLKTAETLIAENGCELLDAYGGPGWRYLSTLPPGKGCPEDAGAAKIQAVERNGTVNIYWYRAADESETAEEAAEREAREAKLREQDEIRTGHERNRVRRLKHLWDCMSPLSAHAHAIKDFCERMWNEGVPVAARTVPEELSDTNGFTARICAAILGEIENGAHGLLSSDDVNWQWQFRLYGKRTAAYFEMLKASGYELSQAEAETLVQVKRALRRAK